MIRFIIITENEIFGWSGHISKDIKNDFDKYIKIYGFSSADNALEGAKQLGITDCIIKSVKC